jgi:hypothetical protein
MVMETKFTPGPWTFGNLPWRNGDGYAYGGESTVSIPFGPTLILGAGEKANARLIAAAPEMYVALLMVASKMDPSGIDDGPMWQQIRASIAKAEGR